MRPPNPINSAFSTIRNMLTLCDRPALALRCAQVDGATARLWAGAGIVEESEPAAEVAETTAKLDAVLTAMLG